MFMAYHKTGRSKDFERSLLSFRDFVFLHKKEIINIDPPPQNSGN